MKRSWLAASAAVLVACGGKVLFESDDGSVCDENGACRFDAFSCPAECVAGLCGEPCTACSGDECFDGVCDVEGFCRSGAVCPE
jgi:hypothetical protein